MLALPRPKKNEHLLYDYPVPSTHLVHARLLGTYYVSGIEKLVVTKINGVLVLQGKNDLEWGGEVII